MEETCTRRGLFGTIPCRFEARYDVDEKPTGSEIDALFPASKMSEIRRLNICESRTYLGDICVSCGRWVYRPEGVPGGAGG